MRISCVVACTWLAAASPISAQAILPVEHSLEGWTLRFEVVTEAGLHLAQCSVESPAQPGPLRVALVTRKPDELDLIFRSTTREPPSEAQGSATLQVGDARVTLPVTRHDARAVKVRVARDNAAAMRFVSALVGEAAVPGPLLVTLPGEQPVEVPAAPRALAHPEAACGEVMRALDQLRSLGRR